MPTVLVPTRKVLTPRYAQRGTPFTRKAWDNPIKYKLNRQYGDEFEYTNFTALTRRWQMLNTAVAADFDFPGGSQIGWRPSTAGAGGNAISIAAPVGDFEAVLEFAYCANNGTVGDSTGVFAPAIALVDAVGTGAAGAVYAFDAKAYDTPLTTWQTGSAHSSAAFANMDGRHHWLAVRRTGTTLQSRGSDDGATFTSLTTGSTVSATALYLCIAKCYPVASTRIGFLTLYRLNVYPGPTFFTG